MKNILKLLSISSLMISFIFGQEKTLYQGRLWHPKPMQGDKMEDGMAKKTQKYNVGNDNYTMYSFRVITGENQGAVLRVSPKTYSERDKYPLRQAEIDYFQKNVIPYADMTKDKGTSLWLEVDGQDYNGSGNNERLRYRQVIEYLIQPGKLSEWNELREKLVAAHKKAGSKARFSHFNRISGGKTHLIHMIVPFDSWKDYGNLVPIFSVDIYNKAHGKGQHKKWLDRVSEIIQYRKAYIREFLPELSTD